jgi:translation initiation factor IF-3
VGRRHYSKYKKRDRIVVNKAIRFPQVRVIDHEGGQVGIMPTAEALDQARQQDKDLILITEQSKPPVAKIIELSKHKYWLQQKKAEQRKSARQQEIKGVRLTPFIDEGDLQTRLKRIKKFLDDGDKVRIEADFRRGRQRTKKEFGFKNFERIIEETKELAEIEIAPKSVGTKIMMQLRPIGK